MPNRLLLLLLLASPVVFAKGAAEPNPAGPSTPGYLGIQIRASQDGARVIEVFSGGGAEGAGLLEGDVIFQVDGFPLAGLTVKEMVGHLKGALDSQVQVLVSRFPGDAAIEQLAITRGVPPASMKKQKRATFLDPVQREANVIGSSLRSNRLPALQKPVETWATAEDAEATDRAMIRAVRQADILGWATGTKLEHTTAAAFWERLGNDQAFAALVEGREPRTRLEMARLLARHSGSAALARDLLRGLPRSLYPQERRAMEALAQAVGEGDPDAVAALEIPAVDAWDEGGWSASFGPWVSDLAALELARRHGATRDDEKSPPRAQAAPPLPTGALERLERSGLLLPWQADREYAHFGYLAAPLAPAFKVERLDGGYLSLEDHDGPLVLSFWASWCGPCRQELPALQGLQQELAATGLQVWALNTDADRDKVQPVLDQLQLDLTVAYASPQVRQDYGVTSLPRLFALDAQHHLLLDHTGYSPNEFATMAEDITAIARGEGGGERSLGQVSYGAPRARIAAASLLDEKPLLLTTDDQRRLWLGFEDALIPTAMEDRAFVLDTEHAVPLPFPATIARWADLDQDGQAELLLAKEGGHTLRASGADGGHRWTRRDADPLAAVVVLRRAAGTRVVALRIGAQQVPHPLGPMPDGSPRDPVWERRPRLEILDAQGQQVGRLDLPHGVVNLAAHSASGRLALLLDDGVVYELDDALALVPVEHGLDTVRRVQWVDDPAGPRLTFTSNAARSLQSGRLGEGGAPASVAMTGGGDLIGLDSAGRPGFRVTLQRPPQTVVADVDGDGRDELVLYAHWFGLAALHVAL